MEVFNTEDIKPENLPNYDTWRYELIVHSISKEQFVRLRIGDYTVVHVPYNILKTMLANIEQFLEEEKRNAATNQNN